MVSGTLRKLGGCTVYGTTGRYEYWALDNSVAKGRGKGAEGRGKGKGEGAVHPRKIQKLPLS